MKNLNWMILTVLTATLAVSTAYAGGGGHEGGGSAIGDRLVRGNPELPQIALTFDDGPHPGYTQRILNILKTENVKATFFVLGSQVDLHPELAKMEVIDGHQIANHTYDHLRLPALKPKQVYDEIARGADAIERATGVHPYYFRPPGGEYDDVTVKAVKKHGSVMTLWTDDPGDYANPGSAAIVKRTLRFASNGGIILLHDGTDQTIQILPDLIHRLKQQGYQFVTVSELAHQRGAIRFGGPNIFPH